MECTLATLILVWIVLAQLWKPMRRGLVGALAVAALVAIAAWALFGNGG